jgi:ACS family hexuronate transporter-like MFS transporter
MAQHTAPNVAMGGAGLGKTIYNLRWYICGLLFLVTLTNYVDRVTLGVLNPELKKVIGWNSSQFGWINFSFSLGYAVMFGIAGRLLDRFGVKAGMICAVVVWSLASMGHAFVSTWVGFAIARLVLGLGEAANFPGCIKAVTEWFPKRERAFATGIFNAATNVGVMLSPAIALLAVTVGWQVAFVLTGVLGFLWIILWAWFYRSPETHPNLGQQERALILSDNDPVSSAVRVPWTSLLRYRQVWGFCLGKMMTDPVWWFYLTWLPTYLNSERGVTMLKGSVMIVVPYLAADVGSVAGGYLSGFLMKRGWGVGRARLTAMAVFAFCMPAAIVAVFTKNFVVALGCISLATASHQAWSANIFTIPADTFPKKVVASVVGLGGMAGAIGGMFMQLVVGGLLQATKTWWPLFVIAGVMHPLALFVIMAFTGRDFKQADVDAGLREGPSANLKVAGAAVTVVGGALIGVVVHFWDIITRRSNLSVTAQGLTASIGVALLGLALLYASRDQRSAATRWTAGG